MIWRRCLAESLEARIPLSVTPTEISVAVSSTSAVYGQAITLTATVSAASTPPSEGTVSFMDDGNLLGTASVSAGTATLTNMVLNAGNHSITASYTDLLGNYAASVTTPQANSLITTVAGDGAQGSGGINGPATSAELSWPEGTAVDSAGNLFIADTNNSRVLEVNHATGNVTTVAGNGTYGYSGDGGLATLAELRDPTALAFDAAGDLFIADCYNNCVREVNLTTGIITTVAGTGTYGYNGDGGPATSAELFNPAGLAVDSAGDLFIADQANNRVREVNATTGIITTVTGDVNNPWGLTFDSEGNLFVADFGNWIVREIDANTAIVTTVAGNGNLGGSGRVSGPATSVELDYPTGIAVAPGGALYIADSLSYRILEVDPITGIITTIVDPDDGRNYGGYGGALAFDSAGDLFFDDTWNNRVREISNGTLVTISPASLTITAQNQTKVYAAAVPTLTASYSGFVNGNSVASLTTQATISTTATAASSVAGGPYAVTVSGAVDPNYSITYVNGSLTVTAATTDVSVATSSASAVYGQALNLTATVVASTMVPSEGTVTFMADGNVVGTASVSSGMATLNNAKLNAGGNAITATYSDSSDNFAASSTSAQPDSLIETVAGSGSWNYGYAGDDGSATSAKLNYPRAVAADAAGDLFIADAENNVIREVDHATGIITTVAGNGTRGYTGDGGAATAAELSDPNGIAVDASGDLFIADTLNNVVREVNHSTGIITTVAGNATAGFSGDGGAATAAKLDGPFAMAIDSSGNLFIADTLNARVREVDYATGDIDTVAGNGTAGFSGDGGAATAAELNFPFGIAVDSTGNLFIGDSNNSRIREVIRGTGSIITLAGKGIGNDGGDGGAASSTEINSPCGVAIDDSGNLFFADSGNQRVREVANGVSISVTPATLTITADNRFKIYGASLPTLAATYSGFVNGDTAASLTALPTLSTAATSDSSVAGGPYTITVSGAADANYTITYVSGSLTVTPASLTIAADNQTKVYRAALPTLTASYSGFVNGDSAASLATRPILSTTAAAASSVGHYVITVGGADDPNYTITYVGGVLTVFLLPTPVDDVYTIGSGTVTVAAANGLLANDNPSGGLTVDAGAATGATGGTFNLHADGSFTYTPPVNFAGYDQAQYTVSDNLGHTRSATVTVLSQAGGVVWKFYESVLGRDPDDAGLAAWIANLARGGSTGDMAVAFGESDELLDQIIGGYYYTSNTLAERPTPPGSTSGSRSGVPRADRRLSRPTSPPRPSSSTTPAARPPTG